DPGLPSSAPDYVGNPGGGHSPAMPQPQRTGCGVTMSGPGPEVAIERLPRLVAERNYARPAPLAEHDDDAVFEVHIRHAESRDLGKPATSVREQADDGAVPALRERLPGRHID